MLDRLYIIIIYEEYLKKKKKSDIYYYECAWIYIITTATYSYMRIIYYSPVTIIANKTRRRVESDIIMYTRSLTRLSVCIFIRVCVRIYVGVCVCMCARRPKRSVSERLTPRQRRGRIHDGRTA